MYAWRPVGILGWCASPSSETGKARWREASVHLRRQRMRMRGSSHLRKAMGVKKASPPPSLWCAHLAHFPAGAPQAPPPPASLQGPLSFQTSPRHQGHPHHLFDSMSALLPHLPSLPPTSCSLWVLVTSSLPLPLSASVPSSSPGPPSLSLSSCRVSQLLSGLQQPPLVPSSAPRASPALPCGGASVVPKPSLAPHCQQIKSPNSLT